MAKKAAAEKPASKSAAVRALIADGITKAEDVITEAKNRWKLTITKGDYYNAKPKAKKKAAQKKPAAKQPADKTVENVKAVKALIDKVGLEETKQALEIIEALK